VRVGVRGRGWSAEVGLVTAGVVPDVVPRSPDRLVLVSMPLPVCRVTDFPAPSVNADHRDHPDGAHCREEHVPTCRHGSARYSRRPIPPWPSKKPWHPHVIRLCQAGVQQTARSSVAALGRNPGDDLVRHTCDDQSEPMTPPTLTCGVTHPPWQRITSDVTDTEEVTGSWISVRLRRRNGAPARLTRPRFLSLLCGDTRPRCFGRSRQLLGDLGGSLMAALD
jgi:hypothetical protein